jgi:hypothetical protein
MHALRQVIRRRRDLVNRNWFDLVPGDFRQLRRRHDHACTRHCLREPNQSRFVVTEMMHAVHNDHSRRVLQVGGQVEPSWELPGSTLKVRLFCSYRMNPRVSKKSMRLRRLDAKQNCHCPQMRVNRRPKEQE